MFIDTTIIGITPKKSSHFSFCQFLPFLYTLDMQTDSVFIREGFWADIEKNPKAHAHIIMIATKPDIIKQALLFQELKNR